MSVVAETSVETPPDSGPQSALRGATRIRGRIAGFLVLGRQTPAGMVFLRTRATLGAAFDDYLRGAL